MRWDHETERRLAQEARDRRPAPRMMPWQEDLWRWFVGVPVFTSEQWDTLLPGVPSATFRYAARPSA